MLDYRLISINKIIALINSSRTSGIKKAIVLLHLKLSVVNYLLMIIKL